MPIDEHDVRRIVNPLFSDLSEKIDDLSSQIEEIPKTLDKTKKEFSSALAELRKPVKKTVIEEDALIGKEIRDTLVHRTKVIDIGDFDIITVFVNNELDQTVTVQAKGNFTPTHVNSVSIGTTFDVAANSVEARNLSVYTTAWMPFSFCELKCATAPTKGAVHVKYLKRVG